MIRVICGLHAAALSWIGSVYSGINDELKRMITYHARKGKIGWRKDIMKRMGHALGKSEADACD